MGAGGSLYECVSRHELKSPGVCPSSWRPQHSILDPRNSSLSSRQHQHSSSGLEAWNFMTLAWGLDVQAPKPAQELQRHHWLHVEVCGAPILQSEQRLAWHAVSPAQWYV